ncbi:SanA/YdcF family protein [Microlunatus speluncae]|uniref:SanA/YdcF family protein n=1 Tax=Microlunatus speluncae TaxID=2594267 RepID=UPI001C2CD5D0|nr:ElyC/SanA/YdcF family protein [Microlunatus speluncae]
MNNPASSARSILLRIGGTALGGLIVGGLGLLATIRYVRGGAGRHLHSVADVPTAPVALVLGAKVHPDGHPSSFLAARLDLALRLYRAGKVERLLLSGDGVRPEYDEPGAMIDYLLAAGVPAERLLVDRAGLDTYDSCLRARTAYGCSELIIVSQTYHLPRAIGIARRLGLVAHGVGDSSVRRFRRPWLIGTAREQLAYLKAAGDLISRRDPVHPAR